MISIPIQTFGEFTHNIPESDEYLTIHFSPSSIPRKQRWKNYGMSADFLGDYFAAFFPGDRMTASKINRRDTIKATVSFVANELLENAVKYNEDTAGYPITVSLYLYEHRIIFQITNHTDQSTATKYQQFVQELIHSNSEEFYTQQLERAATGSGGSCMGLLTMINDYSARFGWKFQVLEKMPEITQVSVIAYLDV